MNDVSVPVKSEIALIKGTGLSRGTMKSQVSKFNSGIELPLMTFRKFGCRFCEWRGTSLCPLNIPKGSGKPLRIDAEFMCERKENFLKMFYTGKSKHPTHKAIIRDYRQGMLQLGNQLDWNRLFKIDDKIASLEDSVDPLDIDKLSDLKKERDIIHSQVNGVGMELAKIDQKELDRESRDKNTDKMIGAVGIHNINKLIAGDFNEKENVSIDADYEDLLDQDNENLITQEDKEDSITDDDEVINENNLNKTHLSDPEE